MSSRIAEVLGVLKEVAENARSGASLADVREHRLSATKRIAEARGIEEETVRDACTRQLKPHVQGVAEFDALVHKWLANDSPELRTTVLHHTVDDTDKNAVERFFSHRP
jgi:hypothetical protein